MLIVVFNDSFQSRFNYVIKLFEDQVGVKFIGGGLKNRLFLYIYLYVSNQFKFAK